MSTRTARPKQEPWEPAELTKAELLAVKQVAAGAATDMQQKLCMDTIIYKFCGYYDISFRPDGAGGARATDFSEGKRFVASRIVEALQRPNYTENKA